MPKHKINLDNNLLPNKKKCIQNNENKVNEVNECNYNKNVCICILIIIIMWIIVLFEIYVLKKEDGSN